MNKTLIAIPILVIVAVICFSLVVVFEVMQEQQNCSLWIRSNTFLLDEEYRNKQVGFSSFPNTTNEDFFKIRFHADYYQCDRWWDYDTVLDDLLNDRVGDNYFNDMLWRSNK